MNTLTKYTTTQLQELTIKEITAINNCFSVAIDAKQTSRFANKPKAIEKCLSNQSDYFNSLPVEKPTTKVTKTGSRFDTSKTIITIEDLGAEGTIQNSIHAAISATDGNIENVIQSVLNNHKRPRSDQPVDREYVIHNIKWFIKKGSLEIVA